MGVIGTNVEALIFAHFLKSNPKICLEILYKVTNMNRPVGIGEARGGYNRSFFHRFHEFNDLIPLCRGQDGKFCFENK